MVSEETKRAIIEVWGQIASDLLGDLDVESEMTNEIAIETCIDANRLSTFGHAEAEAEILREVEANGYEETLKSLSEKVRLL